MKYILAGILFSVSFTSLLSQTKTINNGILKIEIDSNKTRSSIQVSHTENKDTALIENLTFWIYGKSNGKEYLSVQNNTSYNDFSSGTIQYNNPSNRSIHKVTQPEIKDHSYLYSNVNYTAPNGINNWPGNRTATDPLASFVDLNKNQLYEPNLGEYPFIRGDQCLLKIENDLGLRSSLLEGLGVEVAQYFFVFPNSGDPVLDNTIGFRWVFQNRSNKSYDTALIGIHFHSLLQSLNSNYIGTDVINNCMYTYTAENTEKQFTSIALLNGTIQNSIYYLNEGQPNNKNELPTSDSHFINYLHGRWKDGDSLKLGSTGLDGDSSVYFVFPNNTVPGYSSWSEDIVGNQGGDRNGIMTTAQYQWKANEYRTIEGAILFSNNIDSLPQLYKRHKDLKHVYNLNRFTTNPFIKIKSTIEIYPNPVKNSEGLTISGMPAGCTINVFGPNGQSIYKEKSQGHTHHIDPNFKSSGLYLIQIFNDKTLIESYKIVVIK